MANRLSNAAKELEITSKKVAEGTISPEAMADLKAGFADLQKEQDALSKHISAREAAS